MIKYEIKITTKCKRDDWSSIQKLRGLTSDIVRLVSINLRGNNSKNYFKNIELFFNGYSINISNPKMEYSYEILFIYEETKHPVKKISGKTNLAIYLNKLLSENKYKKNK